MIYLIGWSICGLIAAIYSLVKEFKKSKRILVRDLGFVFFALVFGAISLILMIMDLFEKYGDKVIYKKDLSN